MPPRPAKSNAAFLALIAACCGVLTSCSSSTEVSVDTVPFSDVTSTTARTTTTLIAPPDVTVGSAVQGLVDVHASWLCEIQRRTFASPSDADDALATHLEREGVSLDRYETFVGSLPDDQQARDAVLFAYQENCLRSDG